MDKKFEFSYSAPTEDEREEVERIRARYTERGGREKKLARLRALDKKVNLAATGVSITLGIFGILIFGGGMALTLSYGQYVWGIALSAIGILPMATAYPAFVFMLRRGKKKYGDEILRLSEEILNEE